jgi:hypothetical protein
MSVALLFALRVTGIVVRAAKGDVEREERICNEQLRDGTRFIANLSFSACNCLPVFHVVRRTNRAPSPEVT